MDMTKPFAAQDFDALDTFDMDDEFIGAVASPAPEPVLAPAYSPEPEVLAFTASAAPGEGAALTEHEPYNPVGALVAETETAAAAVVASASRSPEEVGQALPIAASVAPQAAALTAYEPGGLAIGSSGAVEVSIPRIAVHVFAERQDTLASAERAGQDRRMSRATTQIRIGGVAAAIEAYGSEPTPPLIVVECMKDAQTLLAEIDQLAEVCDAGTKVVIIGATNDILLFRELMRRGVSEYLVAPVQPLQLISAIGGLFADPAQPFVGRSIAFVGARGGAGASAVATTPPMR